MGSILPSSSSAFARQSKTTVRCLQVRFNSGLPSSRLLRDSLPQSTTRSQSIRTQQTHSPLIQSTCQCRQISTLISRPFSKAKSTKTQTATPTPFNAFPPGSTAASAPPLPLTNLPYFIRRTPSNQLPVYLVTKAGGTKQETRLRKTEGDLDALRSHLVRALSMEEKPADVAINRLNGHITIKGWRKPEVQQFLLDRKF